MRKQCLVRTGSSYAAEIVKAQKICDNLRRRYGITLQEYLAVLKAQGGGCAVCKRPPDKMRLHVDHCHSTRRVRGILCFNCNTLIGKAGDNPEVLRAAAAYLERPSTV